LKIGGDKARQKEEANAKDKDISTALYQSFKHIFNSTITESMRVFQEGNGPKPGGVISFSGHVGDWFHPRTPEDFTISLGREIPDPSPIVAPHSTPSRKIVSIDKLLAKAAKTLRRNGSVLVCGGRGAGKTATLNELSNHMNTHLIRNLSPISPH
jgi:Cdc6-like AAA superfamily ATPase